MPDAGTTATTTTAVTNMPPSSPETNTCNSSIIMQPFTPTQCLFCPHPSPTFPGSLEHMQKTHGLFVPHVDNLKVDLETLFEHLHLVIFGYRECIKCGRESTTVQGAQQHMTGKQGHCSFDISEPDSEFAQFYNLIHAPGDGDLEGGSRGEDSIRLSSGRIISKKPSALPKPSFRSFGARSRRQFRRSAAPARIERRSSSSSTEPGDEEDHCHGDEPERASSETPTDSKEVVLSKRETRAKAMAEYQLTRMSAHDRNSLMHLPTAQQRSLLAAQHRHEEKVQTDERRRRAKIDRKGNKNLYAYWHTETPVYQCG